MTETTHDGVGDIGDVATSDAMTWLRHGQGPEVVEVALLDRPVSLAGTCKLVSWMVVAVVSGWAWYGLLRVGAWMLRALGVTLANF